MYWLLNIVISVAILVYRRIEYFNKISDSTKCHDSRLQWLKMNSLALQTVNKNTPNEFYDLNLVPKLTWAISN